MEAAPTNAGSYRAEFTIASDDYVGTSSDSFEITKAEITVAAKDRNIYTGDTVPDLTNPTAGTDYTVTGLCGTATVKAVVTLKNGTKKTIKMTIKVK